MILPAVLEMKTLSTVLEVGEGDFTNNSVSGKESASICEQQKKRNSAMFKLNTMALKD